MVQKLVSTAVEESEEFFYVPKLYIGPDPAPSEPTEQLYVVGDAAITGDLTVANVYVPDGGSFGIFENELLTFNAAGTAVFSGCDVGIGTATPGSQLNVNGADGTLTGISFTDGTAGATSTITASRYIGLINTVPPSISINDGFSGIEFGPPGGAGEGYLAFHTHDVGVASAERVRIDKSGNVSIGIVAGDGTLHVHQGTAGAVQANIDGVDLVIESDGVHGTGMSLLSPDDKGGNIYYGCPADNDYHAIFFYGPTKVSRGAQVWFRVAGSNYPMILTSTEIRAMFALKIQERAAAVANTAGYLQLWVKNDTPNVLMIEDDAGNNFTVDVTPV